MVCLLTSRVMWFHRANSSGLVTDQITSGWHPVAPVDLCWTHTQKSHLEILILCMPRTLTEEECKNIRMLRLTLTISKSSKMVAFSPQSTTETCSRRSEWILKSNLFLKMIQLVFNCANSKTRTKATLAPLLWIKSTSMETTATTNLSHYKVIAGVTFRK